MLSEYDSVRVIRLEDGDRWSDGSPSIGDIGTIVDVSGSGADTRYIVEHAPRDGTPWWVAEFTEDELVRCADRLAGIGAASQDPWDDVTREDTPLDVPSHRSKPSSGGNAKSASKARTEEDPGANQRNAPLISCAAAGALASILFVHFLGAGTGLAPLFVAGIAGAIGGFSVEPIVDSLVVALVLAFISVVVIYSVDSSLPREVILASVAGLAIGKLIGSIVNEVLELRHGGRC